MGGELKLYHIRFEIITMRLTIIYFLNLELTIELKFNFVSSLLILYCVLHLEYLTLLEDAMASKKSARRGE